MSTHPDPAALVERLKNRLLYQGLDEGVRVLLTDAITALSAAPSDCAEAGERADYGKLTTDEWLEMPDYKGTIVMDPDGWDRAGNFMKSWEERITETEFKRRLYMSTCKFTPRPSPSPAGGADGEILLLKRALHRVRAFLNGGNEACDWNPTGPEERKLQQRVQVEIDAIDAATQATPAKEGK